MSYMDGTPTAPMPKEAISLWRAPHKIKTNRGVLMC